MRQVLRSSCAGGTKRESGDRPPRLNGLGMARNIVSKEGLRGLYRGFGLSVVTFVPSSAVWWSAYAGYQKAIWTHIYGRGDDSSPGHRVRVACSKVPWRSASKVLCMLVTQEHARSALLTPASVPRTGNSCRLLMKPVLLSSPGSWL